MNSLTLLIALFTCGFCMGCRSTHPVISTNNPKNVQNLQQEFYRLTAQVDPNTKDGSTKLLKTMMQLIDECDEATRYSEFKRLVTQPENADGSPYDTVIVQAFLYRFLNTSNSMNSLVQLLAARCPEQFPSATPEYVIARERGIECMNIIIKAFVTAMPKAARELLNCLSRAFPKLRHEYDVDSEFVNACTQWIHDNQSVCEFNERYPWQVGALNSWGRRGSVALFLTPKHEENLDLPGWEIPKSMAPSK